MNCCLEIYLDGRWQAAAIFEPDPQTIHQGIEGGCRLSYDDVSLGPVETRNWLVSLGDEVR